MQDADVLVGASQLIRDLREEIDLAARSDATVLVAGDPGAGKDTVARLIHAASARAAAPFVTIQLTSASCQLPAAAIEAADGGTVFFDGVCAMTARMQALLLQFLETREIQCASSDPERTRVDVRIVAGTDHRLFDRVAEGHFREDLYYRLNVIYLPVPPLPDQRRGVGFVRLDDVTTA